jgi:hypothetical protein
LTDLIRPTVGFNCEVPYKCEIDDINYIIYANMFKNDDIIKVPAQEFEVTWNAKGNSWVDGELEETGTWSCFAGWLEPREVDAWKEIEENMNK